MPLYRHTAAEMRRVHRDADWVMTGAILDGTWHPILPAIQPAGPRLAEADLIDVLALLPVIARNDAAGVLAVIAQIRARGLLTALDVHPREVLRGTPGQYVKPFWGAG
jgi:hypothetical protein